MSAPLTVTGHGERGGHGPGPDGWLAAVPLAGTRVLVLSDIVLGQAHADCLGVRVRTTPSASGWPACRGTSRSRSPAQRIFPWCVDTIELGPGAELTMTGLRLGDEGRRTPYNGLVA